VTQSSKGELVVKSVATAVVATAIVESGLSLSKTLARQPIIVFSLGLMAGYFTHKYRKEIIAMTTHTAEQGKDFIVQQKQHLSELLAEVQGSEEQKNQAD
jgi:predicted hydrocarbon binding protein